METLYIVSCETTCFHKINNAWQYEGSVYGNNTSEIFLNYADALEYYTIIKTKIELHDNYKYITSKYLKSVDIDINNATLLKDNHGD